MEEAEHWENKRENSERRRSRDDKMVLVLVVMVDSDDEDEGLGRVSFLKNEASAKESSRLRSSR
jgi:hypothetical protein